MRELIGNLLKLRQRELSRRRVTKLVDAFLHRETADAKNLGHVGEIVHTIIGALALGRGRRVSMGAGGNDPSDKRS